MSSKEKKDGIHLIEISWEVCNKRGGIYTVLATKAQKMREIYGDNYILVGPRIWQSEKGEREQIDFEPCHELPEIVSHLRRHGHQVVMGRWKVPGEPRCILVDFSESYKAKNDILERFWDDYKIDSLTGGWDYHEPVLFGYAVGQMIQAYSHHIPGHRDIVCHWHGWMAGAGMLLLKKEMPEIASVFTAHSTVLGRAIAATGENLFETLKTINPNERASSLNLRAKFSLESACIREADFLTTVSAITRDEVAAIYGRKADQFIPSALGSDFPDPELTKPSAVASARDTLYTLAESITCHKYKADRTSLMLSGGRYEYINKGFNLIVDSLPALESYLQETDRRVLLFFMAPANVRGPNQELQEALQHHRSVSKPRRVTHDLTNPKEDPLLLHLDRLGLDNSSQKRVHVIFIPVYLTGEDSLITATFYQLLAGFDLTLFPSHYDPWGYMPLESIGYGVPTVTSDSAGFGRWAMASSVESEQAVFVLPRQETTYETSTALLSNYLKAFIDLTSNQRQEAARVARTISERVRWSHFARLYEDSHRDALNIRDTRFHGSTRRYGAVVPELPSAKPKSESQELGPRLKTFTVCNLLPPQLQPLRRLAYNLWWAWNWEATELFRDLDPEIWESSGRNPVKMLNSVAQERLEALACDLHYLNRLHDLNAQLDLYLEAREQTRHHPVIAYFCMEYGIHESLPIYSGGLGILAGDHLKEASDLGFPLVAVGLAYRHGYFRQRFDINGVQIDEAMNLDFMSLAMTPVRKDGEHLTVKLYLPGRKLTIQVWEVNVGAVRLLLLDTDHPANSKEDREITGSLYGGGTEIRLKQEMVLGIGGHQMLLELGIHPEVWHMNEGHASFLVLARVSEIMHQANCNFRTALEFARHTGLFTTHTPVPAGHDTFGEDLMRPHFSVYQDILKTPWEEIMNLGRYPGATDSPFSMTLLGMRGSAMVNAVSKIHEGVSKKNLQMVVPGFHWTEVPVGSITNGVHGPTWLAPEFQRLFDEEFGKDWRTATPNDPVWQRIRELPDEKLRPIRRALKAQLLEAVKQNLIQSWELRHDSPSLLNKMLGRLQDDVMVFGFARRFAPYKRATLLFRDLEALARIVANADRPILILFAGKAHPADGLGKELIRKIFEICRKEEFLGRIILLENYDMRLARYLVHGCDVWLNTPTRPLEASGTSGMKAAMNGCVNVSVLDGWWAEGYNAYNGWAIGEDQVYESADYQDEFDSQYLYTLLEKTLVPTYYRDGRQGLSEEWLAVAKESIATLLPQFGCTRMLREYRDKYYETARTAHRELSAAHYERVRESSKFKKKIQLFWEDVSIVESQVEGLVGEKVYHGDKVHIKVVVHHPKLTPRDLCVEFVIAPHEGHDELIKMEVQRLKYVGQTESNNKGVWTGIFTPTTSGTKAYGIRVVPNYPIGESKVDTQIALVKWA